MLVTQADCVESAHCAEFRALNELQANETIGIES